MKGYLYERAKSLAIRVGMWCLANLYAGALCVPSLGRKDLLYLNLIILGCEILIFICDYGKWKKNQERLTYLVKIVEDEKTETVARMIQLQNLSDYVARWSHEAKLPLTSLKLMNERNADKELKRDMASCIARLENLLQTVLMGSKLQCLENDIKYECISLENAVHASIQNQSYFLIHEQFDISVETRKMMVYSDRRWLVYLLDQLIGNAVKYKKESPRLAITAERQKDETVILYVTDNGIGISDEDLPYIFDKGYVGKTLRKGDYHSTGMGLYFVKEIAKLLHISVEVFSREGEGCCIALRFRDMSKDLLIEQKC